MWGVSLQFASPRHGCLGICFPPGFTLTQKLESVHMRYTDPLPNVWRRSKPGRNGAPHRTSRGGSLQPDASLNPRIWALGGWVEDDRVPEEAATSEGWRSFRRPA